MSCVLRKVERHLQGMNPSIPTHNPIPSTKRAWKPRSPSSPNRPLLGTLHRGIKLGRLILFSLQLEYYVSGVQIDFDRCRHWTPPPPHTHTFSITPPIKPTPSPLHSFESQDHPFKIARRQENILPGPPPQKRQPPLPDCTAAARCFEGSQ
jgi:hypothetical protein